MPRVIGYFQVSQSAYADARASYELDLWNNGWDTFLSTDSSFDHWRSLGVVNWDIHFAFGQLDAQYTAGYDADDGVSPKLVSPVGPRTHADPPISDTRRVDDFVSGWSTRIASCEADGGEVIFYIGPPPIDWGTSDATVDSWTTEIEAAGGSVAYDVASAMSRDDYPGALHPTFRSVDRMIARGTKVYLEPIDRILTKSMATFTPAVTGRGYMATDARAAFAEGSPSYWKLSTLTPQECIVLLPKSGAYIESAPRLARARYWLDYGYSVAIDLNGLTDSEITTLLADVEEGGNLSGDDEMSFQAKFTALKALADADTGAGGLSLSSSNAFVPTFQQYDDPRPTHRRANITVQDAGEVSQSPMGFATDFEVGMVRLHITTDRDYDRDGTKIAAIDRRITTVFHGGSPATVAPWKFTKVKRLRSYPGPTNDKERKRVVELLIGATDGN